MSLADWSTTLSLVFGGCCSNAITLEQLTSTYPLSGSLITFFQFLLISLHGLPSHISWTNSYYPKFRPRHIPLRPYLVQVALFYLISLLNNAAFSYEIPMSVHIIFRSGGLVVSMLLGWAVSGKKYTFGQVISVLLVTLGVVLTTLSAADHATVASSGPSTSLNTYIQGIAILSLALLLSGFLGLVQDHTYSRYGRTNSSWQESMFYLHFLALPMFVSVRQDIISQLRFVSSGARTTYAVPVPFPHAITKLFGSGSSASGTKSPPGFLNIQRPYVGNANSPALLLLFNLPRAYAPLLLNTLTQLICVAGVHRLTTRVSALTVTLILVVRKAVSLLISVLWLSQGARVDQTLMWSGAVMVLVGTVGYSVFIGQKRKDAVEKEKKE
ncbi:UAA transporter [Mycena amicta]|nr:UAA transporter [Mycena amicta]